MRRNLSRTISKRYLHQGGGFIKKKFPSVEQDEVSLVSVDTSHTEEISATAETYVVETEEKVEHNIKKETSKKKKERDSEQSVKTTDTIKD